MKYRDPHLFQAYRYEISRIIVMSYKFQYISTVLCDHSVQRFDYSIPDSC